MGGGNICNTHKQSAAARKEHTMSEERTSVASRTVAKPAAVTPVKEGNGKQERRSSWDFTQSSKKLVYEEEIKADRALIKEGMRLEARVSCPAVEYEFNRESDNDSVTDPEESSGEAGKDDSVKGEEEVTSHTDTKKRFYVALPMERKLTFYQPQTATTVVCHRCSTEFRVSTVERFYKCERFNCGGLTMDQLRGDYVRPALQPELPKENDYFDEFASGFHAIMYSFTRTNGPRMANTERLWRLKNEAVEKGLLPKDSFNPDWKACTDAHRYIKLVESALRRKNKQDFMDSLYCLLYVMEVGHYRYAEH